ncbi:MAG: NAD-glutamate dehydrogenase, partial [Gammaproteobacteria bacterium]|nr:NAD-glutamate dehydrogenase [Gammaproteobacteria bacterium]
MHAVAVDDSRLLRSIPTARVALIDRIARSTGSARRSDLTPRFLRAYFHGVGEEDLAARRPRDLAKAALAHLELGARRTAGRTLVKVFNPTLAQDGFESPHTLVLTVTDDMPFLVDSIGMSFGRAELAVHLIVHPVLQVRRDRGGRLLDLGTNGAAVARAESWQLYEIDRVTDPRQLQRLREDLAETLADVRIAVSDWGTMRERARAVISELASQPPPLPAAEVSEAGHLLEWMEQRHFVFLGYRRYRLERGRSVDRLIPDRNSGLGILSPARRHGERAAVTELRGDVRQRAREQELLIITKANSLATVHRGEFLDYVGVKIFDSRGRVSGEHRFLGLWTSTAYHGSPRDIPVLRHKVDRVIEHFGLDPASHDGKAVLNVLETYPRDELFQARVSDLIRIVRGVVNLYERRTVRLLVRRDPYHRFYSCLVYVPRDRYNTEVRQRIEQIAREGFSGGKVESNVQVSGSSHARVHVVVHTDPQQHQHPDFALIERRIAEAALTWNDRLSEVLTSRRGEARGLALAARYRRAFPLAYEETVSPHEALQDIDELEALREQPSALKLNLYRPPGQILQRVHLKIVKLGEPVPISDVLPMLENFGLRVISERPYELHWPEGGPAWIQDFELEQRERQVVDPTRSEETFREAFAAAWSGAVENDGFNRLLLAAALNARQVVVLRAYCRYLLQAGVPFSQTSMERALAANAPVAQALVRLFEVRFDPEQDGASRSRKAAALATQIRGALDAVSSLDDDRILRAYLGLLLATSRTNYYQTEPQGGRKPYLSLKFDPAKIQELPLPRPRYEIFVYSPRVEGVHLRMGEVARGGIRWSDRRDDFRTEVLGLMKAQNVKNTLIVPVGAKGGFVAKRLPAGGNRDEVQAEVVACYQTFIR